LASKENQNYMLKQRRQKLEIREMEFMGSHGVYAFEKQALNKFLVTVTIWGEFGVAMTSDNLEDTLDYSLIYNIAKEEMAVSADLIEHLAKRIGDRIAQIEFPIEEIYLQITKCEPPLEGKVSNTNFEVRYSL
jgi:dihydroneopterin aldolase